MDLSRFLLAFRSDGVTPFADLPRAPLERPWEFSTDKASAILGPEGADFERLRRGHLWVNTDAVRDRGKPDPADFMFPIAEMVDGKLTAVWAGLDAARADVAAADIPPESKARIALHIDRYVRKINAALPKGEKPKALSGDEEEENEDLSHTEEERRKRKKDAEEGVWVQRYDRGSPLLSPKVRADGTLLMTGRTARPGVLEYQNADGSITRELVLAENLHRPDALATLARSPVTLEHPPEEVTPDNVGQFGVGDVDGEVHVEADGFVTVRIAVRRRDAIDAILAGKQELSEGYRVRVEARSGVHADHGPFDAVQGPRLNNHLAIVDRARAGPSVRLRTDGAAYQVIAPVEGGSSVNPLIFAMLQLLDVPKADAEDPVKLAAAKLRLDAALKATIDVGALQETITTLQTQVDTLTGERDGFKVQVDEFTAAAAAKVDAAEREGLDKFRESLKLDSIDKEDNAALLRRMAVHLLGDDKITADTSDGYIQGVVGSAMAQTKTDAINPWEKANINPLQPRVDAEDKVDDKPNISVAQMDQHRDAFQKARGGAE